MSLTSFNFFAFIIFMFFLYYSICKKYQKLLLILCSVLFYYFATKDFNALLLLVFEVCIIYISGLLISRYSNKSKIILVISISALILVLFIYKYSYNLLSMLLKTLNLNIDLSMLNFISIMGLSYYTLSAIGYIVEVYWKNIDADNDLQNIALFLVYFPQLISGPITRYKDMKIQFKNQKVFNWNLISVGVSRMVFGYYKKLVVSERFALITKEIFSNYNSYNIVGVIIGVFCYAVELYTDFSGCMDIVLGISQIFGIKLPENFDAPFFSKSLKEFWQRWHITLGLWFKDFVMYPLQISKPIVYLQKKIKNITNKKIGRKVSFFTAMAIMWLLLGIWHGGTPVYFIASGILPCVFLIFGNVLKTDDNENKKQASVFIRRLSTFILICICWYFVCCNSVTEAFDIFNHCIKTIFNMFNYRFYPIDIKKIDLFIMLFSFIILFYIEKIQYNNTFIFEMIEQKPLIKDCIIVFGALIIMFFGKVESSAFIYFKF